MHGGAISTYWGLPLKRYRLISIDPPWHFKSGISRRHASHNYPTMPLKDIRALPVKEIAEPNGCALMMWTTPPFLYLSTKLMIEDWGFKYSSVAFYWIKLKKGYQNSLFLDRHLAKVGTGHTTRKSVEIVILGKIGKPKRLSRGVEDTIFAPPREHSRKPDEFFERAAALYDGPRVDIFSRETRPGWDSWGDEKGKFDERNLDGGASPAIVLDR